MTLQFQAVAASRHALNVFRAGRRGGGEVHSAYRRTINIRFPDDQLVSLHGGRNLAAPFGIALGHRFRSPSFERIAAGAPVEAGDDVLRIPGAGIEVALAGAVVWDPSASPTALRPQSAEAHAEVVAGVLLRHDNPDGLAGLVNGEDQKPLTRRARESAAAMVGGLARRHRGLLKAGADPLLGLGPGLTPSGDDFLAGFLGIAVLGSPTAAPLVREVGKELLHLAETRTTLLSRAFLGHALEGVLAPPVDALAAAVLTGATPPVVARAAQRAAALGHTSGLDMLAGIVFALRALGEVSP